MNAMKLIAVGALAAGLATGAAQPAAAQTPVSACGKLARGSYKLTQNLTTTGSCSCWPTTSSRWT